MTLSMSMYQASVPVFVRMLKNLGAILDKGLAHAEAKKIAPNVLPATRLVADMFPLSKQVQIATDHAKGAVARLAGVEVPKYEDNEQSLEELKVRIARTIGFIESFKPAQIDGTEERDIAFTLGGRDLQFKGMDYLVGFALPNFYFHLVTAYNLLRHNGVDIGKGDYMGQS